MNRKQLSDQVAQAMSISPAQADNTVQAVFDAITGAVATGERVQIAGFGTFERRSRAARTGRNPQTGQELQIPASEVPAFKAASAFKAAVQG